MIKVSIIDGAIDKDFIKNINKERNLIKFIHINNHNSLNNSKVHGTVCLSIFLECIINAEINYVDISNENNKELEIHDLVRALEVSIKQKPNIIIMSIGTTNFSNLKKLSHIIRQVYEDNIIMICAKSNENFITYPACLPKIIEVEVDKNNTLNSRQYIIEGKRIIISVPKLECIEMAQRLYGPFNIYSNSLGAPYAASIIYKMLYENTVKQNEILKQICKVERDMLKVKNEYFSIAQSYSKKLSIPIIGIDEENSRVLNNKVFREIVSEFLKKGYICTGIGLKIKTDYYKNLFRYDEKNNVEKVINYFYYYTNPDIMVILIKNFKLKELIKKDLIDILITSNNIYQKTIKIINPNQHINYIVNEIEQYNL